MESNLFTEELEHFQETGKYIKEKMINFTDEFESAVVDIVKNLCQDIRISISSDEVEIEKINTQLSIARRYLINKFETLKQVEDLMGSFQKRKLSEVEVKESLHYSSHSDLHNDHMNIKISKEDITEEISYKENLPFKFRK